MPVYIQSSTLSFTYTVMNVHLIVNSYSIAFNKMSDASKDTTFTKIYDHLLILINGVIVQAFTRA